MSAPGDDELTQRPGDHHWLPGIPQEPLNARYEIVGEPLGKGGCGVVYRARKKQLQQWVAIKRVVPRDGEKLTLTEQQQFVREVALMASITHPHVVRVEAWGCDSDGLYIVMELLEQGTLSDLVRNNHPQGMPTAEVLRYARQICLGLQALHQKGILHRDLKPSNLLLDSLANAKLADFGLARETDGDGVAHDSSSNPIFSPPYASPEQIAGQPLDVRTDIFSLGATLYHLACGSVPSSRLYDLDEVAVELRDLLGGLLQKIPDRRPATVDAVLEQIDELIKRQSAGSVSRPAEDVRPARTRWPASGLLTVALACIAVCALLLVQLLPERNTAIEQAEPAGNPASPDDTPETAAAAAAPAPATIDAPATVPTDAPQTPTETPAEWTNSLGMKFRLIPAGTFLMGTRQPSSDARPQHAVTISKPFWLAAHEVTQGVWQEVMGIAPWQGQASVMEGPDVAATYVSWEDAVEFCQRLSLRDGKRYRLPTEAEWEYACRAGTTTEYSFGDEDHQLENYAWWGGLKGDGNCGTEQYAHRVGQKQANPFGLFDMHGNAWEWCQDWYDDSYYSAAPVTDPQGPATGSARTLRGGAWETAPVSQRSCFRYSNSLDARTQTTGCRVLIEYP